MSVPVMGSSHGCGGTCGTPPIRAENHNSWNGCVTDRDQDYDTTSTAASPSVPGTLFPAEQYNVCPVAVQPMTYDWSALSLLVGSMTPAGTTNQAIGLAWGWLSLTAGGS